MAGPSRSARALYSTPISTASRPSRTASGVALAALEAIESDSLSRVGDALTLCVAAIADHARRLNEL